MLIGYFGTKPEPGVSRRFPIEGVGSLLFGLWLVTMPGFFADVLMFLLGFILIMGGVQQIASLSMARRWTPVPGGFYVIPVLILIAGIVALFNPTGARNTAFMIMVSAFCPPSCTVRLITRQHRKTKATGEL